MSDHPLVELRDASIGYDGAAVIEHVDLRIESGDVVALLGANGSGKSTLVRGILGLADLTSGSILLFGEHARHVRDRWRIGYVPQRTNIAGAVPSTVREVVTTGRLARVGPGRRLRASDHDAVTAALATVELGELAAEPVRTLSGGQQRRVTIARALAAEPELLILDEPAAGVDAENQARLADTLTRAAAGGTTIVLVAHELGPAAPLIGRVVIMGDGGISFDGPPDRSFHGHSDDSHDLPGCEHLHEHGDVPPRPGTGIMGW